MAQLLPVDVFDLVIFGGTGDLAMRKLLPALYHRARDGQFSADSRIIATSRGDLSSDEFIALVKKALQSNLAEGDFEQDHWDSFSTRLTYIQADALNSENWQALKSSLDTHNERCRVFYMATAPRLFGPIAQGLKAHELNSPLSRIVLEKPVGHDFASAELINNEVGACFNEHQIFRIDHYLGKETVQNLLALRFANSLFEPLWRRGSIDHVQITVAEDLGVAGRVDYYDRIGAMRDMVQNHLLQLVCLVAMESPASLADDAVRDEKIKVLRALRKIDSESVRARTVRGQYTAGAIGGETVSGYSQELGHSDSETETFVALKLDIDNWRWSNVPFYLRTGKRLARKHSEIAIQFQDVPHSIFEKQSLDFHPNRLLIRLQPDEGVRLAVMAKEPGPGGFDLRPVSLNLSFEEAFGVRYPDAYERLLMEVLRGNPSLFMRRDEVEAAWSWTDSIIAGWQTSKTRIEPYVAGTWGPGGSSSLLDRDGRSWLPES